VTVRDSRSERRTAHGKVHYRGAAPGDEGQDRLFLPPHAVEEAKCGDSAEALMQELERIGVVRRLGSERVDIPDLFRVAAAMGRRGGVRPIR
jgi:hypothetical protein